MEYGTAAEQGNQLALKLAELFAAKSETCSVSFMSEMDTNMSQLMKKIETEVRIEVAKQLSELRRAPEKTVVVLANDDPDVAEPILTKSTVISSEEIIKIARNKGKRHQMAIAKRELLPSSVSDVLIEFGDRDVKVEVASNRTADISGEGFKKLLEAAKGDQAMQEALSERHDMCDEDIFTLISIAVVAIRRKMIARGDLDNLSNLSDASRKMAEELANEFWLNQYDFETSYELLEQVSRERLITEQDIRTACMAENFADAVAAFTIFTRTDLERAKNLLTKIDPEPFAEAAKKAKLQIATVTVLLKTGPWKRRLTDDVREAVLKDYQRTALRSVGGRR